MMNHFEREQLMKMQQYSVAKEARSAWMFEALQRTAPKQNETISSSSGQVQPIRNRNEVT